MKTPVLDIYSKEMKSTCQREKCIPTLTDELVSFLFWQYWVWTQTWTQGLVFARQVLYHLSHTFSPFYVMGFFEIGSPELFTRGWLRTSVLWLSASWVARTTGVSHWRPADVLLVTNTWKCPSMDNWIKKNVVSQWETIQSWKGRKIF
jgi:hypothetical protein